MADKDTFESPKKLRNAELIVPPNILKEKMGSAGIDDNALFKAQYVMESHQANFRPIAKELLARLDDAINSVKTAKLKGEPAIEALLYPAMQLKAQGAMFRFPLITEVSSNLIRFLESIKKLDASAIEIVHAHKMAMIGVITNNVTGNGDMQGEALKFSLTSACSRYYKNQEKSA